MTNTQKETEEKDNIVCKIEIIAVPYVVPAQYEHRTAADIN